MHLQNYGEMRTLGLWRGASQLLAAATLRWHAPPAGAEAAGGGNNGMLELALFAASELQHDAQLEQRPTDARQVQLRRAHCRLLLALCVDAALALHDKACRKAGVPPGSERACVLVLAHVAPGRHAFWRLHGFLSPQELPREWRAAALGAVEHGTPPLQSFATELDAEARPETLALVAKPWVDYVASAVDALPY